MNRNPSIIRPAGSNSTVKRMNSSNMEKISSSIVNRLKRLHICRTSSSRQTRRSGQKILASGRIITAQMSALSVTSRCHGRKRRGRRIFSGNRATGSGVSRPNRDIRTTRRGQSRTGILSGTTTLAIPTGWTNVCREWESIKFR